MMNFADLALYLLCGFAVPLAAASAIADTRAGMEFADTAERPGGHFLLQWMTAFLCGPGLLGERLISATRDGSQETPDLVLGWLAVAGWATLYGYVVLGLMTRLIAI